MGSVAQLMTRVIGMSAYTPYLSPITLGFPPKNEEADQQTRDPMGEGASVCLCHVADWTSIDNYCVMVQQFFGYGASIF